MLLRLGLKLLSRVKPSEILLKSINKDVTEVEVIHPTRLYFLLCSCCWWLYVVVDLLTVMNVASLLSCFMCRTLALSGNFFLLGICRKQQLCLLV